MKKWVVLGLALLFAATLVGMPSPAAAQPKVGIRGFVLLDFQYGDKLFGGVPIPSVANTPLDTNKEKDHRETVLDARQSRLAVTVSDTAGGVNFSGLIEADFFTTDGNALTSNSRHLGVRHAFARADHPSGFFLLAGQFWSLFSNIVSVPAPNTFTAGAAAGRLVARQPQLKVGYRRALSPQMGNLVFEADVEKHSLDNLGSTAVDESQGEGQDLPLFVGKVSWFHPIFEAEAAGAVGSNRVILTGGDDDREPVWGVQVSVGVKIGPVRLAGHYNHLDGLQRLAAGRFPSAFLVGTDVRNVESDGWYAGLTYDLTTATSFNFLYGWEKADEIPGAFTGARQEKHRTIQVTVLHKFWERWQVGFEYRRFDVEAFDGTEGDANFFHAALWYFF